MGCLRVHSRACFSPGTLKTHSWTHSSPGAFRVHSRARSSLEALRVQSWTRSSPGAFRVHSRARFSLGAFRACSSSSRDSCFCCRTSRGSGIHFSFSQVMVLLSARPRIGLLLCQLHPSHLLCHSLQSTSLPRQQYDTSKIHTMFFS